MNISSQVREASIEATVIRCTCGHPESHPDAVCPQGASEALGEIAYYHSNPLKRWWHHARRVLRKRVGRR